MQNYLYKHQQRFLDRNVSQSALIHSAGTGKTKLACHWALQRGGTTLIVCPKALHPAWLREVKETNVPVVLIFTKEEFRKDGDKLKKFDNLIWDECHLSALSKSQTAKVLHAYIKRYAPNRLFLTATVYTSSPWAIYNLATLLGYKLNYIKFKTTFFSEVRMGARIVPIAKKGMEAKLADIVKKIADVVDINDVLPDLPPQIYETPEEYSITPEQHQAITDAYDPLPIVRFTAQHRIENQSLLKLARIRQLVEENPKIVIVCRYLEQIEAVKRAISPLVPYILSGDTKDRDGVSRAADMATEAVAIIQSDMGIGFELPSFPICVFASMSYSYASYIQMLGRFLRVNKPSCTAFLYLLTEGDSVDKAIWEAVQNKKDFDVELYARNK